MPLLQEFSASILQMTTILVSVLLRSNLEWMSMLRLLLQTPIADHNSSRDKAPDREDGSQLLALAANQKPTSVARVCNICFSNDHHTSVCPSQQSRVDEHPEAYALAANHKPTSVGRVCDIRSSNDHHSSVCPSSQQSGFSARNDAIVIKGLHDVATDTSAETRKLKGMLDALVNLVTQLAVNQKSASVARVCGIRSSKDHHTSVFPSSQQSGFSERNDAIVIRGVHDVAIDTSVETRKLEGKLDALVNLVTQLAANRIRSLPLLQDYAASVLPITTILVSVHLRSNLEWMTIQRIMLQTPIADHHNRVHDVATDTSAETRKLEGKQDALVNLATHLAANQKHASFARVCANHHSSRDKALDREEAPNFLQKLEGKLDILMNLVTQLAANQKSASVARGYGIHSSNDQHTSVCPSSQQYGVDEHPKAYAANTYSRPPQQWLSAPRGVHDVATDASAETRKMEGKLHALVNFVTQLAAKQKPASVARVWDIRSSNDHHTTVCPSLQQSGIHLLEGKLAALVNLVTQLSANQKSATIARVCSIRSSNDHHTIVCPSLQQSGVDELPRGYAANTYSRPPQQ
ncbi:hypothetical protein Fmac_032854 [Flemingia macrophylla]|uniref:Uncharacterized protein n=1 Tax=Flemingia macrophylla TaxID=520843 RepID=A0ABD1L6I1_9FABA